MSDAESVYEVKDANKSHTISAAAIDTLYRRTVRQGKDAVYVIYFKSVDLTLTCKITRGKGR